MSHPYQIIRDVKQGTGVKIWGPVNLYECEIGNDTMVGSFVEIQRGVKIGARCKISSHSFLCEGVEVQDEVFIGHGVMFTNDRYPRATNLDGTPKGAADWTLEKTIVEKRASIGSGAVIMPGLTIGEGAMVGAGAVVTRSVPARAIVVGSPAKVVGEAKE